MLDKKVKDLINSQINKELYSAYLYLDFANYYEDQGLSGFAHWYDIQGKEEVEHAMKLRTYLFDNGERVTFDAIAKPDKELTCVEDGLKAALDHERYVTACINEIYTAAKEINDYKTMEYLNWFVREQVEEEKNAEDLLKKYQLFGKECRGLYALDKDMMGR